MSSTDERRHMARRLAEHDVAIDLEPRPGIKCRDRTSSPGVATHDN